MGTSEVRRKSRRRPVFLFGLIFIGLLTIYVGGCRRAGNWLVKENIPPHADAMVLLMGSFPERVLQVADLYHRGVAERLIIVYEGMGPYKLLESRGATVIRTTEQARDAAKVLGIPDSCITMLPGDARSTLDEALAVREYIAGKPWLDTLVLVSSPAHMQRSYIIFRAALDQAGINAYLGTSPSIYSSFDPKKWWRRREDIQSVVSEWVKLLSFIFFDRINIQG